MTRAKSHSTVHQVSHKPEACVFKQLSMDAPITAIDESQSEGKRHSQRLLGCSVRRADPPLFSNGSIISGVNKQTSILIQALRMSSAFIAFFRYERHGEGTEGREIYRVCGREPPRGS